jgi:hypothetical protein
MSYQLKKHGFKFPFLHMLLAKKKKTKENIIMLNWKQCHYFTPSIIKLKKKKKKSDFSYFETFLLKKMKERIWMEYFFTNINET